MPLFYSASRGIVMTLELGYSFNFFAVLRTCCMTIIAAIVSSELVYILLVEMTEWLLQSRATMIR